MNILRKKIFTSLILSLSSITMIPSLAMAQPTLILSGERVIF